MKRYRNSSFYTIDWDNLHNTDDWKREKFRIENWPLDYTSEMVVAIAPLVRKNEEEQKQLQILGFICIHSNYNQKTLFTKHDEILVRGIGDGIYDLMLNHVLTS